MIVTGPLDSVDDIVRHSSLITWRAPFSFDLTNTHPDIAYCVEIYNITCEIKNTVITDCDVFEESYTASLSFGFIYEIAVSPRSNITGSKNGTKAVINGNFHDSRY